MSHSNPWSNTVEEVCGTPEHVLRHERELGTLASITETLVNQNVIIADSVKALNETATDLKIIISQQQENIKGFLEMKEKLGEFNTTVIELKTSIEDLSEDLKDRNEEIKSLQKDTSHVRWLNSSMKTVTDNAGVIMIIAVALLIISHWVDLSKMISTLKG